MTLLLRLLIIFLPFCSLAQPKKIDLRTIKNKSVEYTLTPNSLARTLTSDYKTDREKVTSIFKWITENISYNVRPFYNSVHKRSVDFDADEDEDTSALKTLDERVAMDVLERRIAFCDGYARLFKTLCEYAGIKSEIITGYADGSMGRRGTRFRSNHRWNAVYLDSSWQLLDATWASGHLTYNSNNFIQSYNNHYFLTPAKDFARDHYPEDLQWTLLAEPPFLSEFRYSPFKTHGYFKNYVRTYHPASGLIEASPGDTLRFELETTGAKKNMMVLNTAFVDSALIATAAADIFRNTAIIVGNKVKYRYIVSSPSDKWLTVVMNDEVIMRYKLNIRKNFTSVK